ncbi:efflux RND transporter periplasmic adaptor subunit [Neosynechococcus sphagnicola]|uniref:efflux RND transporter periplasmic adaptor subunit n=1 Tax=Neosynechococcus sphagnicola TaxID=1501145 RepID=UPI00068B4AC9|nr:efflux RND transporter periplasmic adaptor subunit [Neosynechococcus sphagnicola]
MTRTRKQFCSPTIVRRLFGSLLSLLLLTLPFRSMAHGGHGNEFGGQATQAAGAVQVDAETAKRMGLKVEPVARQRLAFGIKTTGKIEALPNQQVEVTTPVTGTVIKLLVNPGDRVKAGQPVAVMTTPELADLRTTALDRRADAIGSVQQADADLRLAQQNLTQQRTIVAAGIKAARTEVSFAQERYDKDRELMMQGAIPRRTFLESETKLAEAKATLSKAESALEIAQAQAQLQRAHSAVSVAQAKVSLSGETYQARLRQLGASPNADGTITLTAPIAGVVTDRETTQGESGQDAGKKVMSIVNSRIVQVSGNIYEKDLDRVQTGQGVRVNANEKVFKGRIGVIGAVVEGETRVVPIKAELDNPNGSLKPGMFVDLEVLTDRTPAAVLAIPKSALVETNDKKTIVFVQNGSAFQPSDITLGRESGEFVEVKDGLFDGDMVVTQRATQLYAQSLRGGAKPEDDHGATTPTATVSQNGQLLWWIAIPTGGVIASGTFWAGTYWANRRHRKVLISLRTGNGFDGQNRLQWLFCQPNSPSQFDRGFSPTRFIGS